MIKNEMYQSYKQRAEAEKIRADAAEVRADDLAAIAAQLEAECRGWKELHILRGKTIDDLIAERDEARRELEKAKENERNAQEKLNWLISHDPEVVP